MKEFLQTMALTSCMGSLLALLLTLLRHWTKKVFSMNWHYYMWLVVLLVMMIPIRITLPEPILPEPVQEERAMLPQVSSDAGEMVILDENEPPVVQNLVEAVETGSNRLKMYSTEILFGSWSLVAASLFLIRVVSYLLLLIKVRKHSSVVECPELMNFTNRKVCVRESDSICSPLLIGIFRPTLLLPAINLSGEQLRYILAHECVHLKRQDVLYKWFLTLVKCVHWFNPFVYYIGKQCNLDCETSCDSIVTRNLNSNETRAYAETILQLLSGNNARQIPMTTGMTGKKRTLKQRFLQLKRNKRISKKVTVISVVLAFLLAFGAWFVSGILNGETEFSQDGPLEVNTAERKGEEFTILVEGVDYGGRPDTILAFHFDGKTLTCMDIPRNTEYIRAEDSGIYTIADYVAKWKQPQATIDAVQELFDFPIHYYARLEMKAVEKIVDAIGGIEFDVPYNMIYDDPHQDLHINLKAGRHHLNGEGVMHLLRFRDRSAENDIELRRMMWESVMKEILSQAVFGNRLPDVSELYQAANEHMVTNYPVEDFIKDLRKLQNSTPNNLVFGTVQGRNLVADGRFVFRINHVASTPLLQVFHSATSAEELISVISYENKVMGFSLKLPEYWKSAYETIQFHNQVVFFHKDIFEKYGKGSGMLFSITKYEREQVDKVDELAEPGDCLYWSKDEAYYWNIATDVQYPTWIDRDEEDIAFAETYQDMLQDITFIKNSFSFLETSKVGKSLTTKGDAKSKNEKIVIKGTTASNIPYAGFEQVAVKNTSQEKLEKELTRQGIRKTEGTSVDLEKQYYSGEYSYKENLAYQTPEIKCDENGNISVYFSVNQDNLVDVEIYNAETNERVGQYGIIANNENVYTFLGFDQNETYRIAMQGETEDVWKIQGNYMIY